MRLRKAHYKREIIEHAFNDRYGSALLHRHDTISVAIRLKGKCPEPKYIAARD